MTPNLQAPLKATPTPLSNFRKRLAHAATVSADVLDPVINLKAEITDAEIVIRIPRMQDWREMRSKDSRVDETTGRRINESATFTFSASLPKDKDAAIRVCNVVDPENGSPLPHDLLLTPRAAINFNVSLNARDVRTVALVAKPEPAPATPAVPVTAAPVAPAAATAAPGKPVAQAAPAKG